MPISRLSSSLFSFLALILVSCSDPSPLQTVEGPEDDIVLQNARGYVLVYGPNHDLISISLPTLTKQVIKHREGDPYVYALAGPDSDGRIVYVEDHFFAEDKTKKKHLLKVKFLNKPTDETIFERPGAAMFSDLIEKDISISPRGGKVAFVSNSKFIDVTPEKWKMKVGGFWMGSLEIWSLEKRTPIAINLEAVANRGTAWLPDGKRFVYTTLLPLKRYFELQGEKSEVKNLLGWEHIPTTMIFNSETGESQFLCAGWAPLVSSDGKSVLITDLIGGHTLIDITSKKSTSVGWPGDWTGPIALIGEDLILYGGLPTQGTAQKLTGSNSPLVGPKRMGTLKIANLKTGKFKTVMEDVDPRGEVSFGQPATLN